MSTGSTLGETKHPYVVVNMKMKGGNPVIMGTSTKVIDIAVRYEFGGMTPDEIIEQFPHLTLAQVHDALSYYYENKPELDERCRNDQVLVDEIRKYYPSRLRAKLKA